MPRRRALGKAEGVLAIPTWPAHRRHITSDFSLVAVDGSRKAKASGLIDTAKMTNSARKYITGVVQSTEATTPADAIRAASMIASAVDPSGVSATVAAYAYPTCSEYFGPAFNSEIGAPPSIS